jgi:AcrR family transcriptional regulator
VPRLWTETIEAHRREVRDAIMDATAALVAEHGLLSVTMSQIAEQTGIGRATLYNYFPDVEAILSAWHQRHISAHLEQLAKARDDAASPAGRLEAVLEAYAFISNESARHRGSDLAALLHRDAQLADAEERLHGMIGELIDEAASDGVVRDDVPHDELASYCLSALTAARSLPSEAAVRRLVRVTLAGLKAARGYGLPLSDAQH